MYFAPLKIPHYRNLWLGQAVSQACDALYMVSFMFMVKKLTGSSALVGLVLAIEGLPYLLVNPFVGVLADRIDRRKLMLASDLLSASILVCFAVALIFLGANPPFALIALTAGLLSTSRTVFLPTKNAAIPMLVPRESVLQANALSLVTQNYMQVAGLIFAMTVLAALYRQSPAQFFVGVALINAAGFLWSAMFIARLPKLLPDRESLSTVRPLADLMGGIRYIRGHAGLGALVVLQMLMTLMISPFYVVYLEANDVRFGGYPVTLMLFEATFFFGMIVGNYVVTRLQVRRAGLGFVGGLCVTGLCVAALAWSYSAPLFVLWNLIAGLAVPFAQIPVSAYLQTEVPDAFRGRVNAVYLMSAMGIAPLGMMLGGLTIEWVGLFRAFLIMGFGMVTVSLIGLANGAFRRLRIEFGAQSEAEAPSASEARQQATACPSSTASSDGA